MARINESETRGTKHGRRRVVQRTKTKGKDDPANGELLTPEEWVTLANQHHLSVRELEVLVLTSDSRSRKAMARRLHCTLKSVNKYCERLHKKMKVKDRIGLMRHLVRFVRATGST